jgi:hypothetical protein
MLRHILLFIPLLWFTACNPEHIIIDNPPQKMVEINIKTIARIAIPVREDGYSNFNTTLIQTEESFQEFLTKIEEQKGWSKKKNFIESLKLKKIDFNYYNLIIYRLTQASGSTVLSVHKPKGYNEKEIIIKIDENRPEINTHDEAHYALAYKVAKSVQTVTFQNGEKKIVINNQSQQNKSMKVAPKNCMEWFDGCNKCGRIGIEGLPICTEKACTHYEEFRCTKWKGKPKQLKPAHAPLHHDSELESLPRSPQLSDE